MAEFSMIIGSSSGGLRWEPLLTAHQRVAGRTPVAFYMPTCDGSISVATGRVAMAMRASPFG